jgi:hypothetical protein
MAPRALHRLVLHCPHQRQLVLEPSGMVIDLAAGDEIVVETTAADPPTFDAESFTHWVGSGAELRVLRRGREIYSTFGNPVPSTPPGMSTRSFLLLVGIDKLPND